MSTLSVTNPGTYNSAVGESASLQIQASGLPSGDTWLYSAAGLPSGLSINTRSGLISGEISAAPAPMPSRSLVATARRPVPSRTSPGTWANHQHRDFENQSFGIWT